MKNVLKNIGLLIATLIFAFFVSALFGELYNRIFRQSGTWIDLRSLVGFPLAYILFLTLLFAAFGDEKKKSWIGILLIPAGMVEVFLDVTHIYLPVVLALLGWGVGLAIAKLTTKLSSRT